MLDELPPYFQQARAKTIGHSDLAEVTATALSNLLVAIGREACDRVCLVITDLKGAYEAGSEQISGVLSDLEKETHRTAMSLEPVRINSDELYHILSKRIFETLPSESEINEVAQAYAKAIREARQMDITNESPEQFALRIRDAYPFHPAIRDLYARFRENPGFQQTRGLIRLMRIVISRLWESGIADRRYLIAAHDLDFNDQETLTEIDQINNTLGNAIAHDIASGGNGIAEVIDKQIGGSDTQDACRLLLMASLANVPHAVLGLSMPELIAYLAEPTRDLSKLKLDVLRRLSTAAWYLHSTRDGKLFFKNTQNLNAKLESLVKAYQAEQAVREVRQRLTEIFQPVNRWCYQRVLALPAVDEIELVQDQVTLIITEPHSGSGLRQDLQQFFDQTTYQNRIAFLSGTRNTYNDLIETGKRLLAIQHILGELDAEQVSDNDPQMIQAKELDERTRLAFHSAVRETFTILWFPVRTGLTRADFSMQFEGNRYKGEDQIIALLTEKAKFETEISGENFQKKCERRLFTTQSLPWQEIKLRAATNPQWQWTMPRALDDLKTDCLRRDVWREAGGYVDKGPFPPPKTDLAIQQMQRDSDTGEVTLKVTPLNGDTIYYDIGGPATTASAKVEGGSVQIKEMRASFLVVDSRGEHETGPIGTWQNEITLKHRFFQSGSDKKLELQAAPEAPIYYTTDGSDPQIAAAVYQVPFVIPPSSQLVLAYAERDNIRSQVERIPIIWEQEERIRVDRDRAATWCPTQRFDFSNTHDSYDFIEKLKKYQGVPLGMSMVIYGEGGDQDWVELQMNSKKKVEPALLEECLQVLRKLHIPHRRGGEPGPELTSGRVDNIFPTGVGVNRSRVMVTAEAIHFELGQNLLDWVEDDKMALQSSEIQQ